MIFLIYFGRKKKVHYFEIDSQCMAKEKCLTFRQMFSAGNVYWSSVDTRNKITLEVNRI